MAQKKVSFGPRPKPAAPPVDVDKWVESRGRGVEPTPEAPPAPKPEPVKRLTVEIPASLHARVKAGCAAKGVKISDEVRAWLEREFRKG